VKWREPTVLCEGYHDFSLGLHTHTVKQEYLSLVNRHLFSTPETIYERREEVFEAIRRLVRSANLQPFNRSEILDTRGGRKRRRFAWGFHRLYTEGLRVKDSRVQAMQKLELYKLEDLYAKENRTIQYRDVCFNAALSVYLVPIERHIYSYLLNYDGSPVVMKTLSPPLRALLFEKSIRRYRDPVFIECDHSRFDAHVNVELLSLEHSVYLSAYRGADKRRLRRILKMQRRNKGRTRGGIKYSVIGKRMSGDMNTALGNTIINYAILWSLVEDSRVVANLHLDGDDSVIIVERTDLPKITVLIDQHTLSWGMTTKWHVSEGSFEFCKAMWTMTSIGPQFIREPKLDLDMVSISVRSVTPKTAVGLLASKLDNVRAISYGCPWFEDISRELEGVRRVVMTPDEEYLASQRMAPLGCLDDLYRLYPPEVYPGVHMVYQKGVVKDGLPTAPRVESEQGYDFGESALAALPHWRKEFAYWAEVSYPELWQWFGNEDWVWTSEIPKLDPEAQT